MELKEFRERLQSVARNRLRDKPGAFPRFVSWMGTMQGVASIAGAMLRMSPTLSFAERMESIDATRRINEHMLQIVDAWAQMQDPTLAIEPPAESAGDAPARAGKSATSPPKRKRRDILAASIEQAQTQCDDPHDAPAVWAQLVKLAESKHRPLLGICDDGIKWQDANDAVKFLSFKNLRDRLGRCKAL